MTIGGRRYELVGVGYVACLVYRSPTFMAKKRVGVGHRCGVLACGYVC